MIFIIIVIIAIIIGEFYFAQNIEIKTRSRGKTEQQKEVIKYLYGGYLTFGKMTDADYDRLIANVRDGLNFKQRALNKIGIYEYELREIEPVFLEGYNCKLVKK